MKKITCILCVMALFLGACGTKIEMEENPSLHVAVWSESYKQDLENLWNEAYPQQAGALQIDVIEENGISALLYEEDTIPYDIYPVKDEEIAMLIDDLLSLPNKYEDSLEVASFDHLSNFINQVNHCYLPLAGNGFLFAYNKTKLDELGLDPSTMESFEAMIEADVENIFYFYDNTLFTLPLLSSELGFFPGYDSQIVNFESDAFRNSYQAFQKIRNGLGLSSDPAHFDNWFIDQAYLSGLIGPWMQSNQSEDINGIDLVFTQLPSVEGKALKTEVSTYGYVINSQTQYPNAALLLLQLIHSKAGMQLLVDDTDEWIPFIPETMMGEFVIEDENLRGKIYAMNETMANHLIGLEVNRKVGAIEVFADEQIHSLLEECLDDEDLGVCQQQLSERAKEWIEEKRKVE